MPIKTFRGRIPQGEQKRIRLSTNDGKTGYRIMRFDVINKTPGGVSPEIVAKIYSVSKAGAVTASIDFNDPELLGVNYYTSYATGGANPAYVIFDKDVFNQDIYITTADASGATDETNFYLELEAIKLNMNEATYVTLKDIRNYSQPV